MVVYIILAILLFIILTVLLSNLCIFTSYKGNDKYIEIEFFRLTVYDSRKLKKKDEKEKINSEEKPEKKDKKEFSLDTLKEYVNGFLYIFTDIKEILKYSKKKIKCEVFNFNLTFGLTDAFNVGIGTGIIWGAIGLAYSALDSAMIIKDPKISVNPKYNVNYFNVSYEGTYKIKIFTLLYICIKGAKAFLKLKKYLKDNI